MAQQEPIRVVVEKKGGCFSGCGTALGVLLLIGLAIKYWYVALIILVLAVVAGVIANSQQKQKARMKPGPRDPWLNQVAVTLRELGFKEFARNTGTQLGGAPVEGDIGLRDQHVEVWVTLFADSELAHQAEIGLRAQPNIAEAVGNGRTILRTAGPVLLVAKARGRVVDEFRVDEVARELGTLPLPPATARPQPAPSRTTPTIPRPASPIPTAGSGVDPLEQIGRLAELRDKGLLSDEEFQTKKAELLRRI